MLAHSLYIVSIGSLTLKVYDNTGLAGTPVSTSTVDSASISLPGDSYNGAWSAELVGSVTFPHGSGGVYDFQCDFFNTTMAYVWIDGHLVCQDGSSYKPAAGDCDNPLPINSFPQASVVYADLPFRAHVYYNGNAAKPSTRVVPSSAKKGAVYNDTNHQCKFTQHGVFKATNDWMNAAQVCADNGFVFAGVQAGGGEEVWCSETLPYTPATCPPITNYPTLKPCPGNKSETCGDSWVLETILFKTIVTPAVPATFVGVTIEWALLPSTTHAPIDAKRLLPTLPAAEATRDALQRSIAVGWGPWLHTNMLALVKLPDAAAMTTMLCQKSTGKCAEVARPDGAHQSSGDADVRVGLHAWDRSYVQFYYGGAGVNANVSIEYTVSGAGNSEVAMLITPITCGGAAADATSCADYEIKATARYLWFKAGTVAAKTTTTTEANSNSAAVSASASASLDFKSAGLPPFTFYSSSSADHPTSTSTIRNAANPIEMILPLAGGAIALSTAEKPSVSSIRTALDAAAKAESALLTKTFGAARRPEGEAVKAAAMWTLISTPIENAGAPFCPVSRSWDFAHSKVNADFSYAIFDWDNLFASLIAASGSEAQNSEEETWTFGGFEYAVSNLFQVVKSKVAAGFVPNFAAGGMKSQDRTEPPVGAKVTLSLVEKFGADAMKWVVEVVFNDLLDWNDWFLRKRLKPPLNLVALGTYNDQTHSSGNMQDARFESGLDNSPMYDGDFYNNTNGCGLDESGCGLMALYDVGMSSMFVQECYALANLSTIIGRPDSLREMLVKRGNAMATLIKTHLWDESQGNFVNKWSANATFYPRITPTSFYALQAHAASDAQADTMATKWLLNSSRFCITKDGSYDGNSETCYWGLPSVQASDPAFPALGYWRGYIWGPMAQLTWWSLREYDHVASVRTARKAMCKQLAGLMMSQYNEHRHICENYNPHRTADTSGGDCSGSKFYHWGALTGLIGLQEDGLW